MKPSLFRPVLLASAWLFASQAHGQNQIIREITPIPDPTTDPTGFFTRWMSAKPVTGTRAFIRTERTIDQTSFSAASFNSGRAYIILADGGVGLNEADTDDDGWSDETEIAYALSLSEGLYPEPTPIGTAYYLDPYYFPPINQYPMDVFNLFANSPAFDLSTYYNPDYIAATPGDYSINGSARATRVSPFITDGKVRINAAPAGSLLPRPLALSVASKSIGYINSTTYSYDFLNFALYYTARNYSSASQMETEMLPGDYQVVYRLLSNTTLETGQPVIHRQVPNGTLAIGQKKPNWLIRKATKQLDSASSPIDYTWSGGFLQIDPRLPLNLTLDSLAGVAATSDKLDFKVTDASGRVIWPSSVTQDISASLPISTTVTSFQFDSSYTNTAFGTPTSTLQPTGFLQFEYTRPLGAASSGDNSTVTLRVPVRFIRTYDSWRRFYFSGTNLTNDAISGPNADFDDDGLTNQQEFEAGTRPNDGPPDVPPTITGPTLNSQTETTASISADVTDDGRDPVSERGFVYSISLINGNPLIGGVGVTKVVTTGTTGIFTVNLSGLSPDFDYSVRAFARNRKGIAYTPTITLTNNSLSSLSLSVGLLNPVFSSSILNYDMSLGNGISELSINPIAARSSALIQVRTRASDPWVVVASGTNSPALSLAGGSNTLEVLVSASNGTTKTYTVNIVTRLPNVTLPTATLLTTSSGTTATLGATFTVPSSPTASPAITDRGIVYAIKSTNAMPVLGGLGCTTVPITTPAPPGIASAAVTGLLPGALYVFRAYASNSSGLSYVYSNPTEFRPLSNDSTLVGLSVIGLIQSEDAILRPSFSSAVTSYELNVPYSTSSLAVIPTAANSSATITVGINGGASVAVPSGTPTESLGLNVGVNTVSINVTAGDGTNRSYTLKVIRATSDRANLSSLVLSHGEQYPNFSSGTTTYITNVGSGTAEMVVCATTSTAGALIEVKKNDENYVAIGTGSSCATRALDFGITHITVRITAVDGVGLVQKEYTIFVMRASSPTLLDLPTVSGVASLDGTTSILGGTVTSDNGNEVTERGVVFSQTAINNNPLIGGVGVVQISGPGALGPFAFLAESLTSGIAYSVRAYAANSQGTSYSGVSSFTPVSLNASLSSLSLSDGAINFDSDITGYSVEVAAATTAITMTATTMQAGASMQYRINDGAYTDLANSVTSSSIALNIGSNTLQILVTAQDLVTTKEYTLFVLRPPAANPLLSSLVLSSGTLSPTFVNTTTDYTALVSSPTITITATRAQQDSQIAVQVNGGGYVLVTSGTPSLPLALIVGENAIEVRVTAENSEIRIYTLRVTRQSNNANLNGLSLSSGILNPVFAQATTTYSVSVPFATSTITLTPTAAEPKSRIQLQTGPSAFVTVASGTSSAPQSLNVGLNTIKVVVIPHDFSDTKTYTINVTRAPAPIPLPGETSVQWVPLPSSEPVAKMPLPGAQAALLPMVPMFVYEKHPDSMDDFIQYEVQISTDASDWQTAESAGWLVTGADDPSSPEITATWTSTAPMPEKAFFRVKALPASADLEF